MTSRERTILALNYKEADRIVTENCIKLSLQCFEPFTAFEGKLR